MKPFFILIIISLFLSITPKVSAAAKVTLELPEYSKVYNDKHDPFQDAVAALALAQRTQRNVLIEIGGNWCTWCHKMDAFLAKNPDIYQALHHNFVLLKVNVSDSNENEAFMASLPPVLGYPHMYVSTSQGKMMLSKDTAELLDGDNYSKLAWLTFIEQWRFDKNAQNLLKMNAP